MSAPAETGRAAKLAPAVVLPVYDLQPPAPEDDQPPQHYGELAGCAINMSSCSSEYVRVAVLDRAPLVQCLQATFLIEGNSGQSLVVTATCGVAGNLPLQAAEDLRMPFAESVGPACRCRVGKLGCARRSESGDNLCPTTIIQGARPSSSSADALRAAIGCSQIASPAHAHPACEVNV